MIRLSGLALDEIAFRVCTAFQGKGFTAVLTGGGAASFYAPSAVQSRDLDFVLPFTLGESPPQQLLEELGFAPSTARGTYAHPETPFTLEILKGPLAVGDETITSWATLVRDELVLHVIHPVDCVKDRLSAAIHWNDLSSAKQAAEVAKVQDIDLDQVKRWAVAEGGSMMFERFLTLVQAPS
jgi:hypothetical protein